MADSDLVRPLPQQPDPALYLHLTEKERMIAGYPYKPADSELAHGRLRARQLVHKFNNSPAEDKAGRRLILKELLNPNSAGDVFIEPEFRCDYGFNITIGPKAEINFGFVVLDCAPVTIGSHFLAGPGVHIYPATHPVCPKERLEYELAYPITIGNNVWIGGHVSICGKPGGITIGDGVTIGAGSVVTKDIPSFVVVAGNPAKIIRRLPQADEKTM